MAVSKMELLELVSKAEAGADDGSFTRVEGAFTVLIRPTRLAGRQGAEKVTGVLGLGCADAGEQRERLLQERQGSLGVAGVA